MQRVRSVWPATLVGSLVALVGAWVFFVPLVGTYFDFGFFTDASWNFSSLHWMLLLGPGLVAGAGGLLMILSRSRTGNWLAVVAVLIAGVWLIVGPTLHGVWGSPAVPATTAEPDEALRWIGYFYGPGMLLVFFGGLVAGVLALWAPRPETDHGVVAEPIEGTLEQEQPLVVH